MATIPVGIDISKGTFDVAILSLGKKPIEGKFTNDKKGIKEFESWLLKKVTLQAIHVCMEATGRYYKRLAKYLHALNVKVSVENPDKLYHFIQSKISRTKTDKQDALLIAEYCRVSDPEPWEPKKLYIEELRDWITLIEKLKQHHTSITLLSKELEGGQVKVLHREIKQLEKAIDRVRNEIKRVIKTHENLFLKATLLGSIPSIGDETIPLILAIIDETKFETANQAVAFVGLCPQIKESGSSVRGKAFMTKAGHSLIKKGLYMCALSAISYNPLIKAFYERLLNRGKLKKVALCAAMRKLFRIAFAILKSGKPFDVNHQPQWEGAQ